MMPVCFVQMCYEIIGPTIKLDRSDQAMHAAGTHSSLSSASVSCVLQSSTIVKQKSLQFDFHAGWYGAEVTWTIPFFLMKVSNSSLMKLAALSETSTSGSPCCMKISLSLFTIVVDVVELIMSVLIHLEVALTATNNIILRNSLA